VIKPCVPLPGIFKHKAPCACSFFLQTMVSTQSPSSLKGSLSAKFPGVQIDQIKTVVKITAPDEYTNLLIDDSPAIAKLITGEWDVLEINGHELTRETISSFSEIL
jgi:hypothetical protein